jgi:hypothetical protein
MELCEYDPDMGMYYDDIDREAEERGEVSVGRLHAAEVTTEQLTYGHEWFAYPWPRGDAKTIVPEGMFEEPTMEIGELYSSGDEEEIE